MKLKKGFTLIELLVVIAIIGILAAMILVALNSARQKARDSRIKADMAQIRTMAENAYSDDGNYNGVTTESGYSDLTTATTGDIARNGGTGYAITFDSGTNAQAYCAIVTLNDGTTTIAVSDAGKTVQNPTSCTAGVISGGTSL